MSAVLPFVSYSSATEVLIPADRWEDLYASMQSLKAHVQEYPGCQRFDVFVRAQDNGDVTWDTPTQLEAFLERGYTLERLLADFGGLAAERSLVMEKVF